MSLQSGLSGDQSKLLEQIREQAQKIFSTSSKLSDNVLPEPVQSEMKGIQEQAENCLDNIYKLDGESWYFKETQKFERRNIQISLLPTLIGLILILMVFFWTISLANQKQVLTNTLLLKEDTLRTNRAVFIEIERQAIAGKNLDIDTVKALAVFKFKSDSIFGIIEDSTKSALRNSR